MRLVSFGAVEQERLGLLIEGGRRIIDLNLTDPSIPSTMINFLKGNFWAKTRAILADTSNLRKNASILVETVRLGAPVPRPGLIVCVGLNYKDHADEQGIAYPKSPLLFSKSSMAVVGPQDDVIYPEGVEQLDYEVELGVIIGKKAKKVQASEARNYIAGYCVFHDVSARCAQFGDKQWFRGKSFDTFAPFGPALVTPDEVGDPHALTVTCKVNGEIRQNSNTSKLIHSVDKLIEYISNGHTLNPGDVIATGTPSGVGVFLKPPQLLKRGDRVELEVQHLGKISNRIV
jgi:2-keto-4-pentenoate hydratase/2-oxohepta-3-ene-1,7-dioic acid hydratase in catechol pathway